VFGFPDLLQAPDGSLVLLEIFGGVGFDLMFFQENIEIPTRRDSQQGAQLIGGDTPLAVSLQSEGLKAARAGS